MADEKDKFVAIAVTQDGFRAQVYALDGNGNVWQYDEGEASWYLLGDQRDRR
jgi:hypothetical protein